MAEVLGAVASGLAVAEVGLKAGGTVWKLKRLWKQVQQVPETIRDLMSHWQIEMMDPILSDHETTLGIHSAGLPEQLPIRASSTTMLMSAAYCREALNDLRGLVEDLDSAIESKKRSRRTFARMRVVLKKDTLKAFQERMDKAMKLLQCTQVNYLVANAMVTGAMVADMWTAVAGTQHQAGIKNSPNSTEKPPHPAFSQHLDVSREKGLAKGTGSWLQASRIAMPHPRLCLFGSLIYDQSKTESGDEATYAVRFQLPKWLSHKVWDFRVNQACFGWQASLSTWNIVPDSPGIVCVQNGDLDGLIDLFNLGLASPKDCNSYGDTLFYLARLCSHAHVVKYFCNKNLDQPCIKAIQHTHQAIIALTTTKLPMDTLKQLVSRGLIDTLADEAGDFEFPSGRSIEDVDPNSTPISGIVWMSHLPETFDFVFRTMFPFWSNLSPRRKQGILMLEWRAQCCWPDGYLIWIITYFSTWTAHALRILLSPSRHVLPSDVQAWVDDGASILHQVFLYFLRHESSTDDQDWAVLLTEVLEATEEVHKRLLIPCTTRPGSALELALLQMSMSIIANCGYDLLEFGRREAITWLVELYPDRNRNVGDILYLGIGDPRGGGLYVRALHYGSDPNDWYFETDFLYEGYAGDFWNLLENPHLFMMPGAWMEEE